MAFILLDRGHTSYINHCLEYNLETDLNLRHCVYRNNDTPSRFDILNNGIKVSQIGISGYFKHRDYEISEIYPWCFSGLPQGLLELSSDLSIKLDGNKVGKITKGGGVFEWLGILVNEFKVVPLRQWTKVEFNNNLLSEDLALSMLFLYHAHCTD